MQEEVEQLQKDVNATIQDNTISLNQFKTERPALAVMNYLNNMHENILTFNLNTLKDTHDRQKQNTCNETCFYWNSDMFVLFCCLKTEQAPNNDLITSRLINTTLFFQLIQRQIYLLF